MSDLPEVAEKDAWGVKHLTLANWCAIDETMEIFESAGGDRWTELALSYELEVYVPEEVRKLWAVARGTMVYGHFFYPLWTIGDEQLRRVVDAAVAHAYERFGGPTGAEGERPPFQARIEWLMARRYLDPRWKPRWAAIKDLRNFGSHPYTLTIIAPHDAARSLSLFQHEINQLFASDEPQFVGAPRWRHSPETTLKPAKRLSLGDRFGLAEQLEGVLERLASVLSSNETDVGVALEALASDVAGVRDQLLGDRAISTDAAPPTDGVLSPE